MNLDLEKMKNEYKHLIDDEILLNDLVNEVIFGFSEIIDYIKNNKIESILEIGCGTGILLNELKKFFPQIQMTGLEPLKSGYEKYQEISILKKNNKINIVNGMIENYYSDKKYDLIFSLNVMEHVENWEKYLLNSNKLLNKDGINIVLCPNYDFPYESHYIIPIIINKKITKTIFNKKINYYDSKNNKKGHWEGLNFISKKNITRFLKTNKLNFYFDNNISDRILERLLFDKALKKRHGVVSFFAIFIKKLYLNKIFFKFFKIPFPYLKLIIKN